MPYVVISKIDKPSLHKGISMPKQIPTSIPINQVTVADLLLLPGFSKPLAARLIKFRDKLGGFQSLDQIRKTYGLSDSMYQFMAPRIVL
jgi:DNA uptake protein ComE-like DNA-binding protein